MQRIAALLEKADEGDLLLLLGGIEKRLRRGTRAGVLRAALEEEAAGEEGLACLDAGQLAAATRSFSLWFRRTRAGTWRLSRGRVWLAFLLIRYGGLRLGEVLALDDLADVDIPGDRILVRGGRAREVLIPREAMRDMAEILESPMSAGLRSRLLRLDPGYLRRKFYERAKECGLPGALLNPRALRAARARELVRDGVPPRAVQAFLGRPPAGEPAGAVHVSSETANRILHMYLNREIKMKTSARNVFTGKVTGLVREGILVEVELTTLSGLKVVSVITAESASILNVAEGKIMTATVKAPWVILARPGGGLATSARNKYSGVISSVAATAIAAEVVVDLADGTKIVALVTSESVKNLDLDAGGEILAMFKAFSVILNAD
ncbi:MAG: TOBE domain-containing protein [Desulfovibrio sp.]|jgi:molybdate transport system regulatory protein|nr:TOBE domain-containing protein [Desulfovibrio sp.]